MIVSGTQIRFIDVIFAKYERWNGEDFRDHTDMATKKNQPAQQKSHKHWTWYMFGFLKISFYDKCSYNMVIIKLNFRHGRPFKIIGI